MMGRVPGFCARKRFFRTINKVPGKDMGEAAQVFHKIGSDGSGKIYSCWYDGGTL